ncbi:hypothetical protein NLG97_g9121 [Lecanicillium saksenae]|uniref:Uncharacterized protein n=1 Tax=Lecanicillium saksenae TaxID=468837 RepID=A0ACC1QIS3_9HYPO|nr:hypothetical protein NLG97_g9121 [Lecanicillium saksenae]
MKSAIIAAVFTYLIGALAAPLGTQVTPTAAKTSSLTAVLNGDRDEAPVAMTAAAAAATPTVDPDSDASPTVSSPGSSDESEATNAGKEKAVALLKGQGVGNATIKQMHNQDLINKVVGALLGPLLKPIASGANLVPGLEPLLNGNIDNSGGPTNGLLSSRNPNSGKPKGPVDVIEDAMKKPFGIVGSTVDSLNDANQRATGTRSKRDEQLLTEVLAGLEKQVPGVGKVLAELTQALTAPAKALPIVSSVIKRDNQGLSDKLTDMLADIPLAGGILTVIVNTLQAGADRAAGKKPGGGAKRDEQAAEKPPKTPAGADVHADALPTPHHKPGEPSLNHGDGPRCNPKFTPFPSEIKPTNKPPNSNPHNGDNDGEGVFELLKAVTKSVPGAGKFLKRDEQDQEMAAMMPSDIYLDALLKRQHLSEDPNLHYDPNGLLDGALASLFPFGDVAAQILRRSTDSDIDNFHKMLTDMNKSEHEFFNVFVDRMEELATGLSGQ